jgi:hypothetical protein
VHGPCYIKNGFVTSILTTIFCNLGGGGGERDSNDHCTLETLKKNLGHRSVQQKGTERMQNDGTQNTLK